MPGPSPPPVVVTRTVQAPVVCKVPGLKGMRIAGAKRLLSAAHCALGKVTRKKVVRRKRIGKVIAQKPRKGKTLANGAKVAVIVGKR